MYGVDGSKRLIGQKLEGQVAVPDSRPVKSHRLSAAFTWSELKECMWAGFGVRQHLNQTRLVESCAWSAPKFRAGGQFAVEKVLVPKAIGMASERKDTQLRRSSLLRWPMHRLGSRVGRCHA